MNDIMYENLVRRVIYVAQCECGERDIRDDNPPREKLCSCGKWIKYAKEEYIGKSRFDI